MAGLTESRGTGADTFWRWRDTMYRFARACRRTTSRRSPPQPYVEMLQTGFTPVGEFHYLHHEPDGAAYADPRRWRAIVAAARETGIGLTLLPVFYAHAGFGGAAPKPDSDGSSPTSTVSRAFSRRAAGRRPMAGDTLGVAPHSLRAVTPEELTASWRSPGAAVHIHAAEQVTEVDDCLAARGERPVHWLLDHAPIDRRWCLIHATHLDAPRVLVWRRPGRDRPLPPSPKPISATKSSRRAPASRPAGASASAPIPMSHRRGGRTATARIRPAARSGRAT